MSESAKERVARLLAEFSLDLELEEQGADEALRLLLATVERYEKAQRLAKNAKALAAAPDYDEEAIRDALWAVVAVVVPVEKQP